MDIELEDLVASNPTTVKERIDAALHDLANLAKSERSRAEIMTDLGRLAASLIPSITLINICHIIH
jgi:hypothetical protein